MEVYVIMGLKIVKFKMANDENNQRNLIFGKNPLYFQEVLIKHGEYHN